MEFLKVGPTCATNCGPHKIFEHVDKENIKKKQAGAKLDKPNNALAEFSILGIQFAKVILRKFWD